MINILFAILLLLGAGKLATDIYFRTRRKIYMRIAMISVWFSILCGISIIVIELVLCAR